MSTPLHRIGLFTLLLISARAAVSGEDGIGKERTYVYSSECAVGDLAQLYVNAKFRVLCVSTSAQETKLCRLDVDKLQKQVVQKGRRISDPPVGADKFRRSLFFRELSSGLVTDVYHRPDEPDFILRQKKDFVSCISASLRPSLQYVVEETDSRGRHVAVYDLLSRDGNAAKYRKTKRDEDSRFEHQKEIHYDGERKAIHFVAINDSFQARRRQQEQLHSSNVFSATGRESGDSSSLRVHCNTTVRLVLILSVPVDASSFNTRGLVKGSLKEQKKPSKVAKDYEELVENAVECMVGSDSESEEYRVCFGNLADVLKTLSMPVLKSVTKDYIYPSNLASSSPSAVAFIIGLVSAATTNEQAQNLIIQTVLQSPNVSEDFLRKTQSSLFHIEKPSFALVKEIERFAFPFGDTTPFPNLEKQSRLLLGALARKMSNRSLSHDIARKLEQEFSAVSKNVRRVTRFANQEKVRYDEWHKDHYKGKVLIQSIANARLPASRPFLIRHLGDQNVPSIWRKTAAESLGQYSCNESAKALLDAMLFEEKKSVLGSILEAYGHHPMKDNSSLADCLTKSKFAQSNGFKVKRGIADDVQNLLQKLNFKLALPDVDWEKTIGNSNLGASFGLRMTNKVELNTENLITNFDILARDDAWITGDIGLLGKRYDILKVHACYHGHLTYDTNFLKYFDFSQFTNLARMFDGTIGTVVGSIREAVTAFKNIVCEGCLKAIILNVTEIVVNLPRLLSNFQQLVSDGQNQLSEYFDVPAFAPIKQVMNRLKTSADTALNNFLDVYQKIVDVVKIDVPASTFLLQKAFSILLDVIDDIFTSPLQATSFISRVEQKIRGAIAQILGTKDKIMEAFDFSHGTPRVWLTISDQFVHLWNDSLAALSEAKSLIEKDYDGIQRLHDDHFFSQTSLKRFLENNVTKIFEGVFHPFDALKNLTFPFVATFNAFFDVADSLKGAWTNFTESLQSVNSLLIGIFGPKFDAKFPKTRKPCGKCGCGIYPSTAGGRFENGLSLLATKGDALVSPITGKVLKSGASQVTIVGTEGNFLKKKISIDVVKADDSLSEGRVVAAGDRIGLVDAIDCDFNAIHVVAKNSEDETIDPGVFLSSLTTPNFTWVKECDEYSLVVLGTTIDSGKLSDAVSDFANNVIRGKNPFKGLVDDFKKSVGVINSTVRGFFNQTKRFLNNTFKEAEDFFNGKNVTAKLASTLKLLNKVNWDDIGLGKFKDFGTALSKFGLNNEDHESLGFLLGFEVGKLTTKSMLNWLSSSNLTTELRDKVHELKGKIDNPFSSCQDPETMGNEKLASFVRKQGRPLSGGRSTLLQRLRDVPETVCSSLRSAIPSGAGHYCSVDTDCLGIRCCAQLKFLAWKRYVSASVLYDKCSHSLTLSFLDWTKNISLTEEGYQHKINIPMDGVAVADAVKLSVSVAADVSFVSVSCEFSVCIAQECLQSIPIFVNAKFDINEGKCRRRRENMCESGNDNSFEYVGYDEFDTESLDNLPLIDLQKKMAAYDVDTSLTSYVDYSADAVLDKLWPSLSFESGSFTSEFPSTNNECQSGNFPLGHAGVDFFNEPFIDFSFGPVSVSFYVGARGSYGAFLNLNACFLSMNASVSVVPGAGIAAYGGLTVGFFVVEVSLEITGHILDVSFPTEISVRFPKLPVEVGGKMDLTLRPFSFEMRAKVRMGFHAWFVNLMKTVWSSTLWSYQAPSITAPIFGNSDMKHDDSPPKFLPVYQSNSTTTAGVPCYVNQLPNLPPTNPQFQLEFAATDNESAIKYFYNVGTYRGGNDVKSDVWMGGPRLVSSESLPSGIPLYFTAVAKNSDGLEATAECTLSTYDTTLPSGRLKQAFGVTSNPFLLSAYFVAHDDSPLNRDGNVSIGLGKYASNVLQWTNFSFTDTVEERAGTGNNLEEFLAPREGLLSSIPVAQTSTSSALQCASFCVDRGVQCVSFDFDYNSNECRVQSTIEGPDVELYAYQSFYNFERIGTGHSTRFEYRSLELEHGKVYTINARVSNVLGYSQEISSRGTLFDATPPENSAVVNARYNVTVANGCNASIKQEACFEVTPWPNHRIMIDGEGSSAIFNGGDPLEDLQYTRSNNFLTVYFQGFSDRESGISGYAWCIGTKVLRCDVLNFTDPYAGLSNPNSWTSIATAVLPLEDKEYYVTVQAVNKVDMGGSLVITLGHRNSLTVDTKPPEIHEIFGFQFNETTSQLTLFYNVSDSGSGLLKVEYGVGESIHDTSIHPWTPYQSSGWESQLHVVVEIPDGIPAWVQIRATDRVYLSSSGHVDEPLVLDRTPPIAGFVYDGVRLGADLTFTSESNRYCLNWNNFRDPESGIQPIAFASVGRDPGSFDIVMKSPVKYEKKNFCFAVELQHNVTYYATLVVSNDAHTPLTVSKSSDGVLVDKTPPLSAAVRDGLTVGVAWNYSSDDTAARSNWDSFSDPESSIIEYEVQTIVSGEPSFVQSGIAITDRVHADFSTRLGHGDRVQSVITAINGAGIKTSRTTNGYVIDTTPPELLLLRYRDAVDGEPYYQSYSDSITAIWSFRDPESKVKGFRVAINQMMHSSTFIVYPADGEWADFAKQGNDGDINTFSQSQLQLRNGAQYTVAVLAVNYAGLSTIHSTESLRVDTTAPKMSFVVVGALDPDEDEQLNDDGNYEHAGQSSLPATWLGGDSESGVSSYLVAVGTKPGGDDVSSGWLDFGVKTSGVLDGLDLKLTNSSTKLPVYYVTVKAKNRAGLLSKPLSSSPIAVVKDDIVGVTTDGESSLHDARYQRHGYAVTVYFNGFASDRCDGIAEFAWAIGTSPSQTDIQPFTSEGIVKYDNGSGKAQAPASLISGKKVYCTVKATTKCGNHLDSTSNGIMIDTKKPRLHFLPNWGPRYVATADDLSESWIGNDTDSGIKEYDWWAGITPLASDTVSVTKGKDTSTRPGAIKPTSLGVPVFFSVLAIDMVGFTTILSDGGTAVDSNPPTIQGDLQCPLAIPSNANLVKCCWGEFVDDESCVDSIYLMIGDSPGSARYGLQKFPVVPTGACGTISLKFDGAERSREGVITVQAKNRAGKEKSLSKYLIFDKTAPVKGIVTVLKDSVVIPHVNVLPSAIKCQRSGTEVRVSWSGFYDDESSIQRYEVGIGSEAGTADVSPFTSVGLQVSATILHLYVPHGKSFYASVRAINGAGLTATSTSEGVAVTNDPRITVIDGLGDKDIDFQAWAGAISASWNIDDSCPTDFVSWSIRRIDHKVVMAMNPLRSSARSAIRDNLNLVSGDTYYVVVGAVNVIGLSTYGRSDGVFVDASKPVPGSVYDGPEEGVDLSYQESMTEVSATWDPFGDQSSSYPSQRIAYYDVALGTDQRRSLTRQNVVPFTHVGLNRSVVFTNLNLTWAKQEYFFTVRATSLTGMVAESVSNGIYVGVGEPPSAGRINVNPFINNSTTLTVSWTEFRSSFPLLFYEWALSTTQPNASAIPCRSGKFFDNETSVFDVLPFARVGLQRVVENTKLSLRHNHRYYVTVKATNVAKCCVSVVSGAILVDLTPPTSIAVPVGFKNGLQVSYTTSASTLFASWGDIKDPESGVFDFVLDLLKDSACRADFDTESLQKVKSKIRLTNTTSYKFTDLRLKPNEPYFVRIVASNRAGSQSVSMSRPVLLDVSGPIGGTVTDGNVWSKNRVFQSSLSSMTGMLEVAHSRKDLNCSKRYFDFKDKERLLSDWILFDPTRLSDVDMSNTFIFDKKQIKIFSDGLHIGILRDRGYKKLRSSIIYTHLDFSNDKGLVEVSVKAARGNNVTTSVVVWDGPDNTLGDYDFNDPRSDTGISNVSNSSFVNQFSSSSAALGFHICGNSLSDGTWYVALWCRFARDAHNPKIRWIDLGFDPSIASHEYKLDFSVSQTETDFDRSVDFYVDGTLRGTLTGLPIISDKTRFALGVRTRFGFVPPLTDPFDPFSASAVVHKVHLPPTETMTGECIAPFYDFQSHILSVDGCVGSSRSFGCDVSPMSRLSRPCVPCVRACDQYDCSPECGASAEKFLFSLSNLTLIPGHVVSGANFTTYLDPSVYYLHVLVSNGAGMVARASSGGVVIDVTPPVCNEIFQTDPSWSLTEPSSYQGTANATAAFWECFDNLSMIFDYTWRVTKENSMFVIANGKEPGSAKTAVAVNLTLEQAATYVFSISAQNGAGLKTTIAGAGITVDVRSPDLCKASLEMLCETRLPQHQSLSVSGVASDGRSIGFAWKNLNDQRISYVYASLGFFPDGGEVLPNVLVGYGRNDSFALLSSGKLSLGNETFNVSEITPFDRRERRENDTNIEPGRVVYATLIAQSFSHTSSRLHSSGLLIFRKDDTLLSGTTDIQQVELKGFDFNAVVRISRIQIRSNGYVALGKLTKKDMTAEYGSSAVLDYRRYIMDLEATKAACSRLLVKRIKAWLGVSFYISPLSPIDILDSFRLTVTLDDEPMGNDMYKIVFWNPMKRKWFLAVENSCGNSATDSRRSVSSKICQTWKSEKAMKNAGNFFSQPTQFCLVRIDSRFQNSAPKIPKEIAFPMKEGSTLRVQLSYTDDEGDAVFFAFLEKSEFGVGSLSSDGVFSYIPCQYCYGTVEFSYTVTEAHVPVGPALSANGVIRINIEPVENPPVIFFYWTDTTRSPDLVSDAVHIQFDQNENRSINFYVGIVDPDGDDTLDLVYRNSFNGSITMEFASLGWFANHTDLLQNFTSQMQSPAIAVKRLQYFVNPNFTGTDTIFALGHDQVGSYSNLFELHLYVLFNPCGKHGHCRGILNGDENCTSLRRAYSWSGYSCECFSGYSGDLCENDDDECLSNPCPYAFTCVNLDGSYECVIGPFLSKFLPGAVVSITLLLVIFLSFFTIRRKRHQRHYTSPQAEVAYRVRHGRQKIEMRLLAAEECNEYGSTQDTQL